MAGPSLGQAVVDVVADTSGFKDSLVKGISPGLKELPKRTGESARQAAQLAAKNIGDRSAQTGILKSARALVSRLVDPFKGAFKDIVALGRAMAPALSSSTTVRAFTQSAKIIGDAIVKQWGRLTGQIGKVTDKIVETSAAVWGKLSGKVVGIVRNLASTIGSSEVVRRFTSATSKVTGAISGAWDTVTGKISDIVRGWSTAITKGRNWFFEAGTTVAATVVHAIQTAWSKTTGLARTLVDSISGSKVVGWFRTAASTIGSTVTSTLGSVWQKATNLTQTLVEKVSNSQIVGLFRTAASNLGNEFTRFIAKPLNALGRIGQDMVGKLGGPKVLSAARNVGESISNSVVGRVAKKLIPGFSSAGQQAATSIGTGLTGKLTSVSGQVAGAGSNIGSKLSGAISGGLGKSTGKMGVLGPLFGGAAGPAGIAIGAAVGVVTGAMAAIGTAVTKGFGRLTSIENAEAKLLGLGNSVKDVEVIMDSALKAVEGTVYSLADSATGAAAAVAAGVKPGKDLTRWLTLLADAAQMTGRPLADMGYVLNQVQTMGKVTGDVLFTLESAGLGVTQALAKHLGKSREETRKMVSQGQIDAATFQTVMEDMIGGAAQKAGDTTTGAMANVGNAISKLGASLLEGVFPYFRKFFLGIYDFLQLLAPQAKVFGAALGKSFEIVGKVVVGLAKGIAGGVQAVAGFLDRILGISDAVTRFKQSVSGPGLGALSDLRDAIATGVGPVVEKFRIGWAAIGTAIGKFADAARKVLAPFVKWIAEVFGQVWNGLMAGIREYMPQIKALFGDLSSGIGGLVDIIVPLINKATAALQKWFGENQDGIAEFTKVLGLVAKAVGIVTKHLVGLVVGALAGVFKVIGGIFTVLRGIFTGDGGMILKGFKQIFVDGIGGILKAAGDFVSKSIADIVKKVLSAFNIDLGPTGKKILAGFQGGILQGFGVLFGAIGQQVGKIVDKITSTFGRVLDWVKSTWAKITGFFIAPVVAAETGIGTATGGIRSVINAVVKWVQGAFTTMSRGVAAAFDAARSVIGTVLGAIAKAVRTVTAPIVAGFKAIGKGFLAIGKQIYSVWKTWISPPIQLFGAIIVWLVKSVVQVYVRAFQNIWKGLGTLVRSVWNNVIKPVINAIGKIFKWLWTNAVKPMVTAIRTAWSALGKLLKSVWTGVIKPVIDTYARTFKWLWNSVLKPVGTAIQGAFRALGNAIKSVYNKTIKVVFGWFRDRGIWLRDATKKIFAAIRDAFSAVGRGFKSVYQNTVTKVFGWFSDRAKSARTSLSNTFTKIRESFSNLGRRMRATGTWVKDKVFGAFRSAAGSMRDAFGRVMTGIGKVWERLKNLARKPIAFVVNEVIQKGIISNFNKLAGKFPGVDKLPSVAFEAGGVMPGYTPGRDVHKFYSPTGGNLELSGGEAFMVPEFTKAVGGEAGVAAINAAARAGRSLVGRAADRAGLAFAGGGVYQPVPGRGNRHGSGYPWATWAGDFPNPTGTPVKAWKDGVVAAVKHLTTSYGQHVRVNHDDGSSSLYAHMSKILTSVGAKLSGGQTLGLVGSTGNSTGPHLHFETMNGPYKGGQGSDSGTGISGLIDMITSGLKDKVTGPIKQIKEKFGDNALVKLATQVPTALLNAGMDKLKSLASTIMDKATGLISGVTSWIGSKVGAWTGEQRNNAATIIDVAKKLGFGDRGAIIGLMTAMQESTLRNLSGGDRDSVGLFQQRAPWGSFGDRTNPGKSASMFYLGGQGGQPGLKSKPWKTMGLGQAAQAVQVSAFPGAYSKWEGQARKLLAGFAKGGISGGVYDTGGWLPKGLSVAYNGTGRPERVTAPHQEPGRQQPTIGTLNIELSMRDLEQMKTLDDFLRIVEKARVRGRTTARSGTVTAG